MQFSNDLLDRFVAPQVSLLRHHSAKHLEEARDYYGSFILGYGFRESSFDHADLAAISLFLRRLYQSHLSYRAGFGQLELFVSARSEPQERQLIANYMSAVWAFEQCVSSLVLALKAHHRFKTFFDTNTTKLYKRDDGSTIDRLTSIYDAIRHYDERLVSLGFAANIAPVWLTPEGLAGKRTVSGGNPLDVNVSYLELSDIIGSLTGDAKFLTEDIFAKLEVWKRTPQE